MTDLAAQDQYDKELLVSRGYDTRFVPYEEIHNIRDKDFDSLVSAVDPQNGDYILDAGAGYGAVTREILLRLKAKDLNFRVLDISNLQLERGIKNLKEIFGEDFVNRRIKFEHNSILHIHCDESCFDKVVAKMVIHELPRDLQLSAMKQLYKALKPGGKIVIWDIMLDVDTQTFFQDVIRKKDELAGFDFLAKFRYFPTEAEWINLLEASGFRQIRKSADVVYDLHTSKRLFTELKGEQKLLNDWHEYIRARILSVSADVLARLDYRDHGHEITFMPPKAIYTALKE